MCTAFDFIPNTKRRFLWKAEGTDVQIPVTVVCGREKDKIITISAGVHSREYIGIQAVTELAGALEPEFINGEVILLHCINYDGFIKRTADVFPQDGKNLNREFPGNDDGTETQRLAATLEKTIISLSDYLIDLHSGGFCESLVPHVYYQGTADKATSAVSKKLASFVNVDNIFWSSAKNGFYSHAGTCGVPAIILERGGCGLFSEKEVKADIEDVYNILRGMDFLRDGKCSVVYNSQILTEGYFEEAPCSGCWYPKKKPGDTVKSGETLAEIRDIFGKKLFQFNAKTDGIILYETVSLGIEEGTPAIAYGGANG